MLTLAGFSTLEKLQTNIYTEMYRAVRIVNQQKVILKFLRANSLKNNSVTRLQHEYHLLKQLSLPNIIRAEKLLQTEHLYPVLILENVDGQFLDSYLNHQPLTLDTFFTIAQNLIEILAALHQQQITHKDLRPANIMIHPVTLKLTLVDFSTATQLEIEKLEGPTPSLHEGDHTYRSPEQTGRMNRPIDYRTDFYSLGIIFYEMLTGAPPYQANDPLELIYNHIAKIPAPIKEKNPDVPEILSRLVSKLIAKVPEERYASTTGLKADLNECARQWREKKKIQTFLLGQHDIHERLTLSYKLYGRVVELNTVSTIFDRICKGKTEFLLLHGKIGIGKTSLIQETQKLIVRHKGYFIYGGFSHAQQNTPYSAILTAFQGLITQVLTESEERLTEIRNALKTALGHIGQVIIDIIPAVELIIGKQPPLPSLNSTETQNRFNSVFQNFVRVFTQAEHPLVICLDDLQWADNASLLFIKNLLTDPESRYLLMIGTYPDNERDVTSYFYTILHQIKQAHVRRTALILSNLQAADIAQLLMDTLGCNKIEVNPLADVLLAKTQGNPFYVKEFLKTLYREQLIFFNYARGKWEWDLNRINQHGIADNVVDIQIEKIQLLNTHTQEIIKAAACIGFQFDLQTLSAIYNEKLIIIAKSLLEVIKEQLVLPIADTYEKIVLLIEAHNEVDIAMEKPILFCFAHDRIQQAAYFNLPEKTRKENHLKIGHSLLKNQILQENNEQLYEIIRHFNEALQLIIDPREREQLAQYYLWAGKKAKLATAYPAAIMYLKNGIFLLSQEAWDTQHSLLFALYRDLIECEYAAREVEEADNHFTLLLQKATLYEKAEIYRNKSDYYFGRDSSLGMKNALLGLSLLGVKLPTKAITPIVVYKMFAVAYLLWRYSRKTSLTDLPKSLSTNNDPKYDLIGKLLFSVMVPSFTTNPQLTAFTFCESVIQTLKNGLTDYSWVGFEGLALIMIAGFQHYKLAAKLLEIAQQLHQQTSYRSGDARFLTAEGVLFNHWYYHSVGGLTKLENALQATLETGDLYFRGHTFGAYHCSAYFISNSLPEVNAIAEKLFIHHTIENLTFFEQAKFRDRGIRLLIEQTEEPAIFLNDWIQELATPEVPYQARDATMIILASVFYVLGNHANVILMTTLCSLTETMKATLWEIEYYVSLALALLAHESKKKFSTWIKINKIIKKAHGWKKQNPVNFSHIYYFLLAEKYRAQNKYLDAMLLYDKAIQSAKENNFLRYVALENERAAQMYIQLNLENFAKNYLQTAYQAYQLWGANTKCKEFEKKYSKHLTLTSHETVTVETKTPHEGLDFMAIVKATQAISSEIDLEKLLEKLLSTVLQVAGAERIVLIAEHATQWVVQAEAADKTQTINLFQAKRIEEHQDLPITLLQYVLRTQKSILINDASHIEHDLRVYDPYINRAHAKSLFIIPISYQGKMRYLLYLENNLITHAFTDQHTQSLRLLATQAAISLQNAHLFYQSTHDPLTGLANRNLLHQTFDMLTQLYTRDKKYIAILFFDLDLFKKINDTLGHDVGDKMLIYVADQLRSCLRKGDLGVRLGGDEFVLMLRNIENIEQIKQVAERFRKQLSTSPLIMNGHEIPISCSIGISLYPDDAPDIITLLKQADSALYLAKESGRDCYYFYSAAINQNIQQKKKLQIDLQRSFEENELLFHYQPIYDTKTRRILSIEALIRWQHPEKGLLEAQEFIHLIKQSSLIVKLDEWVLEKICEQLKSWQQKNIPIVPIAINLCNFQSQFDSLSQRILSALKKQQIDPSYLQLELTETIFIADIATALTELKILREHGITIAIDDFGIGFSNLDYLKQLPIISKIKIDQSFIKDIKTDETSRAIVLAMLTLAHHLRLQVIAEGVETEEQFNFLNQHGIDAIQGFYLQKPVSTDACERLLIDNQIFIRGSKV